MTQNDPIPCNILLESCSKILVDKDLVIARNLHCFWHHVETRMIMVTMVLYTAWTSLSFCLFVLLNP